MARDGIEACVFDVFGTVVDWRGSLARDGRALGAARGIDLDWERFARDWRALYQPAMELVRSGQMGFVKLDVLHRQNCWRATPSRPCRRRRSMTSTAPGTGSIPGRTWSGG